MNQYTIDASVLLRVFDVADAQHRVCEQCLAILEAQAIPVSVPWLALAEVAGVLSRTTRDSIRARVMTATLQEANHMNFIILNEALWQQAVEIAADYGLRGADAVYVAIAAHAGTTLISLDQDHLTRASRIVTVQTPAQVLATLGQPS